MKTALVTGATGFIGRHLVNELISSGYKVKVLSRGLKNTRANVEVIKGDITDPASLKKAGSDVDYVFHLAALTNASYSSVNPYATFRKVNVEGTMNLIKACEKAKRFIYFSSVDALGIIQNTVLDEDSIGDPANPYEVSKHESEVLLRKYEKETGLPVTILRPAMVYGEGEIADLLKINVAVLKMLKMIKRHMFPIIGSGKNKLPFTHVKNVVDSAMLALKNKKAEGQTYIIADDKSYELNEVVKTMAELQGVKFPGPKIPLPIARTAAFLFENLAKLIKFNPPLTQSGINYLTANRMFSIKKAKKELGYKPIDLKEGLRRTIEWYKFKGYL